jgi:F-type H+-transporting ATPase subunit b
MKSPGLKYATQRTQRMRWTPKPARHPLTLAVVLSVVALPTASAFAESAGGSSPFAGTIYQTVAAVIVFLVVVFVLQKHAWAPILKGLQDRENKIRDDLHRAEQAAKQADATLKEYQAKLHEARAEAQRIIDTARLEAERAASRIAADATAEIDAQKKRATAEIQYAKETALREIFGQAASLATDVASKILKREIQPADNDRLVRDSLAVLQAKDLQ